MKDKNCERTKRTNDSVIKKINISEEDQNEKRGKKIKEIKLANANSIADIGTLYAVCDIVHSRRARHTAYNTNNT